jgi:hypothetical protein
MAKANLEAGMVIDGFRLVERIHRGGMAAIWRVEHDDIDMPIVMKVPFLDHEGDLSLLVGFEVEQMIMAELTGPHVPRWFANGDLTVQPYIVMEQLQGRTLGSEIGTDEPISLDRLLKLAIEIGLAIDDLHRQHVLHLDLKPANVMFRPDGTAVLIDFGLSRHEQLPDLLEEQFHRPTGTTEYMAPEQLLRIRSDRRSDIFALGAMLYHLATGERPFGAPTRMADVRQRVWREPVPPRALRPDLPPALQEIILKCIEPLPDARYETAESLLFDLRHPDLVELTARAERMTRSGFGTTFGRWMRARRTLREIGAHATKEPPHPPIVVVAVDLRRLPEMHKALREGAMAALANTPGGRLACINVMQTALVALDENVDAEGDNIHVRRLAELRAWAAPLGLPRGKITYHLLEGRSILSEIMDFARSNHVAHLVVGEPPTAPTALTAQLTAEAPCPLTIVRPGQTAEVRYAAG